MVQRLTVLCHAAEDTEPAADTVAHTEVAVGNITAADADNKAAAGWTDAGHVAVTPYAAVAPVEASHDAYRQAAVTAGQQVSDMQNTGLI